MSERKWRVAMLGLGHWYSAYGLARALREYPRAALVGVAWHDKAQLEAFAATFGVPGYDTYDALLDRERIDIVHLAAPVSELADLTIRCAATGKHMILGKPMAMTLDQADRMVDAVAQAGVSCIPFESIVRLRLAELKARVENGEIGDLVLLHQASRWSIAEDWLHSGTPGWFADPKHVPGGALIDEGIYWIDFFRWFSGSDVVRVEATTRNLVHKDIAVEDWGMATFTLANDVVATLEASWTISAPRKTGPSPKQNAVVRLEVIGSKGEIIDQSFRQPGRAVLAAGAPGWVFEARAEEPFAVATPTPLDHLVDVLEGKRDPVASIEDARKAFVAAMAAYDSARAGRPVQLSW